MLKPVIFNQYVHEWRNYGFYIETREKAHDVFNKKLLPLIRMFALLTESEIRSISIDHCEDHFWEQGRHDWIANYCKRLIDDYAALYEIFRNKKMNKSDCGYIRVISRLNRKIYRLENIIDRMQRNSG